MDRQAVYSNKTLLTIPILCPISVVDDRWRKPGTSEKRLG